MTKRILKLIMAALAVAFVFTACSPNPGDSDENAFRIPSDMKQFTGEYTIMLPGDEKLGTEDSPAGTLTITEEDITAMLDLAGSKAPIFGTYESLREFYEFARKADPDKVMINGDIGSYHLFKISSVQYEFYWYDSGEVNLGWLSVIQCQVVLRYIISKKIKPFGEFAMSPANWPGFLHLPNG